MSMSELAFVWAAVFLLAGVQRLGGVLWKNDFWLQFEQLVFSRLC